MIELILISDWQQIYMIGQMYWDSMTETSMTGSTGLDLVHALIYMYNYSKCLFQTD